MAAGFHRAGLMHVDMPGGGAQHALMGTQDGGDHRHIGLGAAHQKMHGGLRGLAGRADQRPGALAVGVLAVAGGLLHIGAGQRLQDRRMRALHIITVKTDHIAAPF